MFEELAERAGICGACLAPIFVGDEYRIDNDGFMACPGAFVDDKYAKGLACHSHRVGNDERFVEEIERMMHPRKETGSE